jgi:hypothetical protein
LPNPTIPEEDPMTKNVISEKSTKTEILEAYHEMLAKGKELKATDQKAIRKENEEKELVRSASRNSIEDIVQKLASLKLEIVKSIDSLEERLIAEHKRFTELQHAITAQSAALEEMFGIQAEAGGLSALILAQKERKASFEDEIAERKAAFESEMGQRRLQWKKEQEDYEAAKKERDTQTKKERQREEEEYTYNLQMVRKKEKDAYEATKTGLESELKEKKTRVEKDLAERESILSSRENEWEDLRARVGLFPAELDKAVKETEKNLTERLELKYKYHAELSSKETEGEKKLNKQTIAALERRIAEQEDQIRQLTQKADDSVQQVQTIAIKAIEGASTQRIFTERAKESS